MWRQREEGRERGISRQLQKMAPGARLPTNPHLRLMIVLRPILKPVNKLKSILKPVNKPERYQRSRMHFAIRKLHLNYLNEIETKTIKPTAVPNDKNTHQNKNKPAPKNVVPSAQDRQEVVLPSAQSGQKVSMFESKEEVKRKNSGCALRRKQLEPSKKWWPSQASKRNSKHWNQAT